jgi:pectin methylesterase-like acyl-CoA thioesterase
MNMKKQIMMLMAVLLVSATAIAVTSLPGVNSNTFHLSVSIDPENAGSVDRPERDIVAGGKATFTATANPGFGFNGWYVNGELVSTANPYQFTNIQSDMNIVAKFNSLAASVLTCSVKPGCEGMGTVTVSPEGTVSGNSHMLTTGTSVTLKATPATGHEFVRWEDGTGTTVSTNSSYTFTIMNDMTLYAVFQKLENYNPDLISFPGAEGYGRFTTGGRAIDSRGSKVYYVTRLDDSNEEGTFRWACTTGDDTPRTILFKVAGTIYLTSRFSVKPNTTIAGQTAPGGGICLAGYQLKLQSNSIVRHIRFRAGDLPNKSMSMLDVENVKNIVLDHCTFAWSMEENLTMYDCDYTTVQWCIFSEGLYDSRNSKGARAYAAQWGGEHGTMHHCLISNCNNRTPRFNGVRASTNDRHVDNEFVNNVIFNWGKPNSLYGGENDKSCNGYNRTYMINNYFRPGPTTKNNTSGSRYFVGASSSNGVGQWMLKGNKFETGSKWAPTSNIWKDEVLEKVNADNLYGFVSNSSERALNLEGVGNSQATYDAYVLQDSVEWSGLVYESADEAYAKVVTQAGASLPRYDEVDARILAEAAGTIDPQFAGRTETGSLSRGMGIINSPTDITLQSHDEFVALYEGDNAADNKEIDVTCFPRLQMDSYDCAVVDTDGDGLPDAYETEVGLNPNDASDGSKLTVSGYSNLEVFLNGVADGQIDAAQYTKRQAVNKMNGFNAIVEPNSDGDTTPIQNAINAAPNDNTPYYIFVKKGTYEGHVQINRANIHLMGQSRENTIISWNKLHNEDGGNVDTNATINVTANDVSFDNLTIRNTRSNEGQALALYTKADRIVITSCNLLGWQDTYRTGKDGQRHLVRNSKISGTTDFIYGAGEAYFDECTLHIVRKSNVIVAPDHSSAKYGYVFRNATITAEQSGSTTALGRPWGNTPKVAYIHTQLTSDVSITAQGWNDMGGLPIQMAEYQTMDANGNLVDLSQRKTSFTADGVTRSSKAVLTPREADSYKLSYMLTGSDGWDADWQGFILPAPSISVSGNTVSWYDATGYAQCFLVIVDGNATLTTDTSVNADGKHVTVQCVSANGVAGEVASDGNPTAVYLTTTNAEVVSRQFYTADGRQVNRLQHGMTIVRETLSDGTTRTTKITAK